VDGRSFSSSSDTTFSVSSVIEIMTLLGTAARLQQSQQVHFYTHVITLKANPTRLTPLKGKENDVRKENYIYI